jgi:hypothetical protein
VEQQALTAVVSHEEAMAAAAEKREAALEKQRVEEVFGLTGGELSDKPWEPFALDEGGEHAERQCYRYHYDGAPSYASEFDDSVYCTVVVDCLFGGEPEVLYEKGYRYERVASFTSSGETECPCADMRREGDCGDVPDPCPLCEEEASDETTHIYLGDGWCEVVYRVVRVCEECGSDFASDLPHEVSHVEQCPACEPVSYSVDALLDVEVQVYRGSDPKAAEAAYDAAVVQYPKHDVYWELDDWGTVRKTLRKETST